MGLVGLGDRVFRAIRCGAAMTKTSFCHQEKPPRNFSLFHIDPARIGHRDIAVVDPISPMFLGKFALDGFGGHGRLFMANAWRRACFCDVLGDRWPELVPLVRWRW